VFAFRNLKTFYLETIHLRPQQVDATLQEEPSMEQRLRVSRLLQKPDLIYPVRVALDEMLKSPNFTIGEEALVRLLESGKLEETIAACFQEFEELSKNQKTKNSRAA
jgi:hypothetical protein